MQININGSLDKYRFLITEAKKNGQKKGREEAWDLARRITALGEDTYTCVELTQVFGACNSTNIFNLPVDEAMEKDRVYQKKKEELHVGDEVKFRSTAMPCGYVVDTGMSEFVTVLTKDKTTHILRISDLAKTGNFNEDLVKGLAAFEDMDGEK